MTVKLDRQTKAGHGSQRYGPVGPPPAESAARMSRSARTPWQQLIGRAGVLLLWLGLGCAAVSGLTAHPHFARGIWSDSEPMVVLFFGAAAICLVGLGLLVLVRPAPMRCLRHPAALTAGGLGLWSLATAGFTTFPLLSVLGPPQTGQGGLWYVALAAFTASALVLRAAAAPFAALLVLAALAALAAAFSNLHTVEWLPPSWASSRVLPQTALLTFNEYQAYFALGLIPIGLVLLLRQRSRLGICLLAVGVVTLLVSRNRTAMVAMAFVFFFVVLLYVLPAGRNLTARLQRTPHLANGLMAGAVLAAMIVPYLVIRFTDLHALAPSIWSRRILVEALEPSLFNSATGILLGHGWGHYSDYLLRNLSSTGLDLLHTQWGGLNRDLFHSHNAPLEAYFAVGLPGLAITVAIPIAVCVSAQRRSWAIALTFCLAWVLVDSLWFMMPATMVYLALAVAVLAESSAAARPLGGRYVWSAASFILAALCVGASVILAVHANQMTRLQSCLPPAHYFTACEAVTIPDDPRGAELGLAELLSSTVPVAVRNFASLPEAQRELLLRLYRRAVAREESAATPLAMALANTDAQLAIALPHDPRAEQGLIADWSRTIEWILSQAPQRLDILPVYLNWLIARGHTDAVRLTLERARAIDPHHPIVDWYTGLEQLGQQDQAVRLRGIDLMRRALRDGVDRFVPIDPAIKTALERGPTGR